MHLAPGIHMPSRTTMPRSYEQPRQTQPMPPLSSGGMVDLNTALGASNQLLMHILLDNSECYSGALFGVSLVLLVRQLVSSTPWTLLLFS